MSAASGLEHLKPFLTKRGPINGTFKESRSKGLDPAPGSWWAASTGC